MSKFHAAAGRYRDALEASGRPRVCSYHHRQFEPEWGPCANLGGRSGPLILEAGHVVELADGGDPDHCVWQCQKHNRLQADYARARRKAAEGKGPVAKTPGKQVATSSGGRTVRKRTADKGEVGWRVRLAIILAALLVAAWWFRLLDPIIGPVVHIGVPCAVLGAVAYIARRVRARWHRPRLKALHAYRMGLGQIMHCTPEEIRVTPARSGAWGAHGQLLRAEASYPGWVITMPGDRRSVREPVEQLLAYLAGEELQIIWSPAARTVTWAPGRALTGAASAAAEERADEAAGVPAGLAESVQSLTKFPEASVKVVRRDDQGPVEVVIRYGSKFADHTDDARANLLELLSTKTGIRWLPEWRYAVNTLALTRHPDMSRMIPNPVTAHEALEPRKCGLGIAMGGTEWVWDRAVAPHLLISGGTGGGKTVLFHTVAYFVSAMGWETVLVDGKGSALAGLRHLPGVTKVGLGDGEAMHKALMYAEAEMRRRYSLVMSGDATFWDFRPMVVLFDEKAEAAKQIQAWWDGERAENKQLPRQAPSLGTDGSIARLGRECGIHLVLATQQAAARYFADATEARDNFGCRVVLGPTTRESAAMMFGRVDVGRDVPAAAKGRATAVVGVSGQPVEIQTYWTPLTLPDGSTKPRTDDDPEPHPDDVRATRALLRRAKDGYSARVAAHRARQAERRGTPAPAPTPDPLVTEPPAPPRQRTRTVTKTRPLTLVELAAAAQADVARWVIVDGEAVQVVEVVEDPTDDGYAQLTLRDAKGAERTVSVPDGDTFEEAPS